MREGIKLALFSQEWLPNIDAALFLLPKTEAGPLGRHEVP